MSTKWNPPTPHHLTYASLGGVVGGLWYLKRCLQPFSFSLPAIFRSFANSLLAHFLRSSAADREPDTGYDLLYPIYHSTLSTYADDKQISYADKDITTVKELINADFPGADNWLDHNRIKRKSSNSSFEKYGLRGLTIDDLSLKSRLIKFIRK